MFTIHLLFNMECFMLKFERKVVQVAAQLARTLLFGLLDCPDIR